MTVDAREWLKRELEKKCHECEQWEEDAQKMYGELQQLLSDSHGPSLLGSPTARIHATQSEKTASDLELMVSRAAAFISCPSVRLPSVLASMSILP